MKCNRTACQSEENVICIHRDTGKMYCVDCAVLINRMCEDTIVHFPFPANSLASINGVEVGIVENKHNGMYLIQTSFENLKEIK